MKLPFGYEVLKVQEPLVGTSSQVDIGDAGAEWWEHHNLFIDYDDNLHLIALKREITRLQAEYRLGDATVWESSPGRYFVTFHHNILTYWECLRILHDTPCDNKFKMARMLHQDMVLRVGRKKWHKPHKVCDIPNAPGNSKQHASTCASKERTFEVMAVHGQD